MKSSESGRAAFDKWVCPLAGLAGGWHVSDFLLRGYFQGKRDAEQHLAQTFPSSGVALRPGFIYGSRAVGAASIPLGAIGAPLEMVSLLEWVEKQCCGNCMGGAAC